jgi:antitoxin HicB
VSQNVINWTYGVRITQEGRDFVATVRDLPEVTTSGDNLEQALDLAADAIDVIVQMRMEDGDDLPAPTPLHKGEHPVSPPATTAAKASLYTAWRETGITKVQLAARLGKPENQARRLLDVKHASTLDALDKAAHAMGYQLVVSARKIA